MGFRVRVYIDGVSPVVFRGDSDVQTYVVLREPSGSGYTAVSEFRLYLQPAQLRPLPAGSDADYEFTEPLPATKLPRS